MLADLDETIRQLLVRYVPLNPTEVEISFDAPDREWSGRLTRPAVNCFLYDVRENTKLKVIGWDVKRDHTNNTATRQRAPLRIDATYQVTTWARAREDEHQLLWRVLAAMAKFATFPEDLLQGELRNPAIPVPISVAQPDQMPTNFADLWQALENRIRPGLTFVVTLTLDPEVAVTRPLTLTAPRLGMKNQDPREVEADLLVRGQVRDRQDPSRFVKGALVLLQETGDRVMTDDEGRFAFSMVPRGQLTLIFRANGRAEVRYPVIVPTSTFVVDM